MNKIFLVGGGTGGHLFPAVAVSQELVRRGYDAHLITDDRCIKYLRSDINFPMHIINSARLRAGIRGKIITVFKLMQAIFKTFILLLKEKPCLVITFGGYVSFPTLLCSYMLRIPSVVHEQNCFLGKVNRWFSKRVNKVLLTFKETKNLPVLEKERIIVTGNPVREEVTKIKVKKNFSASPFRIVVMGGSQGAKVFSDLVPKAMEIVVQKQPDVRFHIIQQAKLEDKEQIHFIYEKCKIQAEVSDFFYDIPQNLADAHLVIARSGASTVAELIALVTPAIFVPYPFAAEKHQHFNAEVIAKSGGGWWIDQDIVTSDKLADRIAEVVNNREILETASKSLKQLKSDSANIIANVAEKILPSCKK